ncbi:MAG: hypothetical protein HY841_13790 [Bacteroidetes bacterium]|nr:hypothetical protein [Bacteroidota bacterium]
MKIVFFNRNDTKIHYYTEPLYVRPLVLIADAVKYISMTAHTVVTYRGLEGWTDELII